MRGTETLAGQDTPVRYATAKMFVGKHTSTRHRVHCSGHGSIAARTLLRICTVSSSGQSWQIWRRIHAVLVLWACGSVSAYGASSLSCRARRGMRWILYAHMKGTESDSRKGHGMRWALYAHTKSADDIQEDLWQSRNVLVAEGPPSAQIKAPANVNAGLSTSQAWSVRRQRGLRIAPGLKKSPATKEMRPARATLLASSRQTFLARWMTCRASEYELTWTDLAVPLSAGS